MSESREKTELVAQVVDVLFGDMLSRSPKVKDAWPSHVKEQMLETQKTFQENHRTFALQLYEEHMSVEQLEELLRFHTSDIGKSIKEAQTRIHKDLSRKYQELQAQKEASAGSGPAKVRSRSYGLGDNDEES